MAFLQPYLLWGLLAMAVPVAIHFWYQKKGVTIEWAAMRWLGGQTTRQHRGLRLNEVWLMLLRCALVALLALILSRPLLDRFSSKDNMKVVHLVQPDALLTETYRFELDKALRNGEQVFWLGNTPQPVTDPTVRPERAADLSVMQQNINAISTGEGYAYRFYLRSDVLGGQEPTIYVPGEYKIFTAADSSKPVQPLGNKTLSEKTVRILLENTDSGERQTIRAALAALTEVYGFVFEITEKREGGKHYDLIFSNAAPAGPKPGTTHVVSGRLPDWKAPSNVIFLPDSLRFAGSELVQSGRLPEWLGNMVVANSESDGRRLSAGQSEGLFQKAEPNRAGHEASARQWLLLVFMGLLIAERWLALRKTSPSHG